MDGSFECANCGGSFGSSDEAAAHIAEAHGSEAHPSEALA
jgi:hypothetical protein